MAHKRQKTVKELNVDVNNLVEKLNELKEEMDSMKTEYEKRIKAIEEKNNEVEFNKRYLCKKCGESFEKHEDLTSHTKEKHNKRHFKCYKCDFSCNISSEYEKHVIESHNSYETFKCHQCDKNFVVEWRMKKHLEMHNRNTKFCHFYNNDKNCTYEKVGCKFRHEDSPKCKYDDKCNRKLCQFQHNKMKIADNITKNINNDSINSKTNDESFDSDDESSDEDEEVVKLNRTAVDKFCENFCQSTSRFHLHSNTDLEMFHGLDLKKTVASFEGGKLRRVFQCDSCEHQTSEFKIHEKHYTTSHENKVREFNCVYQNCDFKTNYPDDMIEHFIQKHSELLTTL